MNANPGSGPVRVTHYRRKTSVLHPLYGLFLLILSIVSFFPPALLAEDRPADRQAVASGDQSTATSGNSVRWGLSESGDAPAQPPLVRQEPLAGPASAATSITDGATSKRLFSHTKWEGPAAIVPREPELHWKGAFHAGRRTPVAADPGVVQTSAQMPLNTVQPVSLPNTPKKGSSDTPDSPPLVQPQGAEPPIPVKIDPSVEKVSLPTFQQQLAAQPNLTEKCISPRDLKSIRKITADISVKPADLAGSKRLPPECSLGDTPFQPRQWRSITFAWTAAGTSHYPLYFEEEQLERYGHSWGNVKQTAVSAVQFFATVPLLPYYMGVYPANEDIYDLGQYRPGDCAPYYLDPLPLSVRGALYEGMFLGVLPAL